MSAVEFKEGLKYSFEVYPSALLKTDFSNVLCLGTITEALARKFVNTRELYVNYYPYLPPGTPNDPAAFSWIAIQTQTGQETAICVGWIKPDTITSTDWQTVIATIQTTKPNAINLIRAALASNDFNDVTIEVGRV